MTAKSLALAALLAAFVVPAPVLPAAEFGERFQAIVAQAKPAELYALLYEMPKGGDLHNHATGANRAEWTFDVCADPARNGGETFYTRIHFLDGADSVDPTARFQTIRGRTYSLLKPEVRREFAELRTLSAEERAAWCAAMRLDGTGDGRTEFFEHIWPRLGDVSHSLPVATELLVENMKAFGAEHLAYLETQFGVTAMVDNDGAVIPTEQAVAYVRERLSRPDAAATGVTVRFQQTILRFAPDAEARLERAYAFVDAHRDLWVGLNMAGIEERGAGYPLRFLDTFRSLRSRYPGIPLSIHAGEMDGPDRHVRDTLLLGATRIGHGVNLIRDPDTLLLLQQSRRVLVEVNLISNKLLGYVPDLAQHPFPEYLRTGVPVCLNTDDRGMWDSNLTDEYYTAVTLYHLSWDEIVAMGRDSLIHSFAAAADRERLLADFDRRIRAFEARFGGPPLGEAVAGLSAVRPVTYSYARRTWGLAFN
jgi:adenosine deaminase CECR1